MPENQAVLFGGLILGVLRILLFQGRAESPMERLAQGKRSGTLGWVIVSKTIYALKGQKRGYCAFVAHPTNPVEGCADANPKTELPNDT